MKKLLLLSAAMMMSAPAFAADDHLLHDMKPMTETSVIADQPASMENPSLEKVKELVKEAEDLKKMEEPTIPPVTAMATILGKDGEKVGEAHFTQGTIGAMMYVKVEGLPPGKHGFHLHKVGTCEHDHGFKTASGHIASDPTMKHGYLHPGGPEEGDLPNIYVHEDGSAELELFLPQIDIDSDSLSLMDEDGSSLMIHELPDDHITQPIGGSGPRIACGIIEAKK